jgi:voltage-gated sodium channel
MRGGSRAGLLAQPELRARLQAFIEHPRVQHVILALILVNAVTLGLETAPSVMAVAGDFILALDKAILSVFVAEIAIRLYVHRWAFFRDPWSVFDFIVVGIALIPATGQFSVLRA